MVQFLGFFLTIPFNIVVTGLYMFACLINEK